MVNKDARWQTSWLAEIGGGGLQEKKKQKKKQVQEKESLLSKSMNHSPKMKPSHLGLLLIPLIKRLGVCRGQGEARPLGTSKLHEMHACARSYPTDTHTNIQLTLERSCKWCACRTVRATFVPTVFWKTNNLHVVVAVGSDPTRSDPLVCDSDHYRPQTRPLPVQPAIPTNLPSAPRSLGGKICHASHLDVSCKEL